MPEGPYGLEPHPVPVSMTFAPIERNAAPVRRSGAPRRYGDVDLLSGAQCFPLFDSLGGEGVLVAEGCRGVGVLSCCTGALEKSRWRCSGASSESY